MRAIKNISLKNPSENENMKIPLNKLNGLPTTILYQQL